MTEWITTPGLVNYETAITEMENRVAEIHAGTKPEAIWLLEHPPLYTGGTSAKDSDLIKAQFPVYQTGRGGQYTYHGPGQRIAYVMLDLQKRGGDIRKFVWQLEEWIIRTLAEFGIVGERREGRIGIWVRSSSEAVAQTNKAHDDTESKIAAIGVRVRHGITYHGLAINVDPDLAHYAGIIPCGIDEFAVTSMAALGKKISLIELDQALKKTFSEIFEF